MNRLQLKPWLRTAFFCSYVEKIFGLEHLKYFQDTSKDSHIIQMYGSNFRYLIFGGRCGGTKTTR